MIPVMVIVIVQELELEAASASIVGDFSDPDIAADSPESEVEQAKTIVKSEAKHSNLSTGLNALSSSLGHHAYQHRLPPLSL